MAQESPGELRDDRRDDPEDDGAHDAIAALHGEARAQERAADVSDGHRHHEPPDDLAAHREQGERGEVRREIDDLGVARGARKRVAEDAGERNDEQCSGSTLVGSTTSVEFGTSFR